MYALIDGSKACISAHKITYDAFHVTFAQPVVGMAVLMGKWRRIAYK